MATTAKLVEPELRIPPGGKAAITVKPTWISAVQKRRVAMDYGKGGRSKTAYVNFQHDRDPREPIFEKIGVIPPEVTQFSRILVAIYQPPKTDVTSGGIILSDDRTDQDMEEYLWQGKVGLIVSAGPQAYVDDDSTKFHGTKNTVGDWVWFRPSDGMACEVNNVFCRILYERDIIGKLPHPDSIW